MVEMEESAQAVAPLHVGGRAPRQWRLLQKPVVESLMVALAVVVLNVLPHEEAHVALTERDHTSETFLTIGKNPRIHSVDFLIDRTNRSAYALRLGRFGGSRMGCLEKRKQAGSLSEAAPPPQIRWHQRLCL